MVRTIWVLLIALICSSTVLAETSELWGAHGEKWTPQSRLPDFSYAGYHEGKDPLPMPAVALNVRDFGAVGDGQADDTAAFEKAIATIKQGAILIPAGRYKITRQLLITKPNVVLRGQGTDQTTLFFPIPLQTLNARPTKNSGGRPTNAYSWSGGLVDIRNTQALPLIGSVIANASRGDAALRVKWTEPPQPGQRVVIYQHDPADQSMVRHLYADDPSNISNIKKLTIRFVARVVRVEGTTTFIDRPLQTDVRPDWMPEIRLCEPAVREVGIEHLSIEFPNTPYRGHFTEVGYNALAFSGVIDCWARDLRILNADSGIFMSGYFCTVDGLVYDSDRKADKQQHATGHHGMALAFDNLVTNFRFNTRFIHDITTSNGASGNVVSHGSGIDLCFDNHARAPYANLFTDIDCGKGSRLWRHGGGKDLGRASGAWSTWWNIRADRDQTPPPASYGPPLLNFVGVRTSRPSKTSATGLWWEAIPPEKLQPQNLYEAQKQRRLDAASAK